MQKGMVRLAKFPLKYVLPHIGKEYFYVWVASEKKRFRVKMSTQRLQLLGRKQKCACCGLEGTYFALEYSGCVMPPHFNLYGYNRYGHEILLTMDHITPKAAGGATSNKNLQLLCEPCNQKKRDHVLSLSELRELRKK